MAAPQASPAAPSVCISLTGVAKRFGKTKVLEGIDLEVKTGEVLAYLVGADHDSVDHL